MTVRDLIDRLSEFNPDAEILLGYPSGDYWRTEIAKPIDDVYDGIVEYSSYHKCDKILKAIDEGEELDAVDETSITNERTVVLIKTL
jgi:hypothetical protein